MTTAVCSDPRWTNLLNYRRIMSIILIEPVANIRPEQGVIMTLDCGRPEWMMNWSTIGSDRVLKSCRGMKAHLVLQYWRSVMVPNDHAPQTCSSKLLEIKKLLPEPVFVIRPKSERLTVFTASFPTPVALDSTTGHMPTVRWKHTKLAICIAWISSTFHQEQIPTVQ